MRAPARGRSARTDLADEPSWQCRSRTLPMRSARSPRDPYDRPLMRVRSRSPLWVNEESPIWVNQNPRFKGFASIHRLVASCTVTRANRGLMQPHHSVGTLRRSLPKLRRKVDCQLRRRSTVALYEYSCQEHGVFDISRPLGTAPESVTCPECSGEARRVISLPMVKCGSRNGWTTAIDHAEKSRHEPEVVTSLPSTGARRRTPMAKLTPALQRLPRP